MKKSLPDATCKVCGQLVWTCVYAPGNPNNPPPPNTLLAGVHFFNGLECSGSSKPTINDPRIKQ